MSLLDDCQQFAERHRGRNITSGPHWSLIIRFVKLFDYACQMEMALQQIDNWAKAYPLDVFPEPDFKRVREVLEAAGITLDSVSASNMRHVITGIARIVEK